MKQIVLFLLLFVFFFHSGFVYENPRAETDAEFDTYVQQGTVVTNTDTHGGFLGDGDTYIKVVYDEKIGRDMQTKLSNDEDWNPLPLTDNLKRAAVRYCHYAIPHLSENGFYYFYDRSSESNNPKDDSPVMNRFSCNFTLAIYDNEENALYWFEYDT